MNDSDYFSSTIKKPATSGLEMWLPQWHLSGILSGMLLHLYQIQIWRRKMIGSHRIANILPLADIAVEWCHHLSVKKSMLKNKRLID